MGDDAPVKDMGSPMWNWTNDLLVEVIGTFALIFIGVGSILESNGNLVTIGLAHGLAIAVMVAASGHISGGAFNPAVAFGLMIARKLAPGRAALYILAEIVGAVLASLALLAIFPTSVTDAAHLGVPAVSAGFSENNAFIAEVIASFFLMYVIFGVAIDKRGPATIAGLAIGLTITIDIFAVGGVSGAAMNPARWFGPALVGGTWTSWWVYLTAPVFGCVLAAGLYQYLFLRRES